MVTYMVRDYVAFISYRHTPLGIAIAKKLLRLIEGYIVPKGLRTNGEKRLGVVFRDRDELVASGDLSLELKEALDRSEYLIVICTPESVSSIWMEMEISYFLQNHDRKNVLTILASGTPEAAYPREITSGISDNIEIATKLKPSEIDIRAKTTRSTLARLYRERFRIFATILQCPYDALVLRNQKRRLKRISAIASAIIVISLSVAALLLTQNRQITRQNIELTQQREQILYRESQLLTQNAENALEDGNCPLAIRNAIAALPGEQEPDRPYYAPAEALLFDGLNIFHTNDNISRVYDTVLEQDTLVEDFCMSDDGTKAITIDAYGTMNCFDTDSADLLWSTYIQESQMEYRQEVARVFFGGNQNAVFGYYNDNLACYDLITGKQLWQHDMGNTFPGYLFYNDESDVWIYASYETDIDWDLTAISFHVLSGKTGEIIKKISFPQSENIAYCELTSRLIYIGQISNGGVFSSDGRFFAGIYAENAKDWQNWTLKCFLIDMDLGTSRLCFEKEIPGHFNFEQIAKIQFTNDDCTLSWVFLEDSDNIKITAAKLDLQSGKLVWEASIPGESDWFFSPILVQYWSDVFYISNGNWLYYLSLEDGKLLDSKQLSGNIKGLNTISNNTFAFVLGDGTYAIGWPGASSLRITTDPELYVTADFGLCKQIKIWREGIIQFYTDGDETEIGFSQRNGPGYVAFVPSYVKGSNIGLTIRRVSPKPNGTDQVVIFNGSEQTGADYLDDMGVDVIYCDAEVAFLGPFKEGSTSYYTMVDLVTQTVLKIFEVDESNYKMHFIPFIDGSGYIQYADDGEVIWNANGLKKHLASSQNFIKDLNGDLFFTDYIITCDSIYLEDTKDILTVRMGEDYLQVWKNGTELQVIPLPSKLTFDPQQYPNGRRNLHLTAQGQIFMYGYNGDTISDMRMFDLSTNTWTVFPRTANVSNWNAVTFSNSDMLYAVTDERDTVWVMNYATGEVLSSFSSNLPCGAISQMQFLLDDEYLAILTEKSNMLVYNIATGEIVLKHLFSSYCTGETVKAVPDAGNQRIYFSCGQEGLCVDLTSWTIMSEIHDMIFFDPAHGILYQTDVFASVTSCIIPNTAELIKMGEKYIYIPKI